MKALEGDAMNYVEPIRDIELIKDIACYLQKSSERNYIMFLMGIYSGLRVSDILRRRIRDVKNKDYFTIREKKTKNQRIIQINPMLKKALKQYCENKSLDEYLIKSREGINKPITRDMAYKILNETCGMFGIANIGTHSMRKTFGYHYYKQTGDVATLQKIYGHSDPSITLAYIGITQEDINKAIKGLRIL